MTQLGIGIDYGTSNSAAAWFDGENIHLMNATGFALHVHPPAYLRNRSNSPGMEITKASNPGAIEQPKRSSQTFGAVSCPLNQPPGPQLRGFQNLSGFAIGGDAIPVVLHGRGRSGQP